MPTIYQWKIYCETEAQWVEGYYSSASGTLTWCPNDAGHTVTSGSQAVISEGGSQSEDTGSLVPDQILVTNGDGTSTWTTIENVTPFNADTYTEVVRIGPSVTEVSVWRDNSKTFKISKETITRENGFVSQVVREDYNADDGVTLLFTYTQTFIRENGIITSETSIRT